MKTEIIRIRKDLPKDLQKLSHVATYIQNDDVVAFPTETVYGLGANAFSEEAVKKIFKAKKRPADNPLIVHVASYKDLQKIVKHIPDYVEKLIHFFSPGPMTYVLEAKETIPPITTGGLNTVAVRIPHHPIAQALIKKANVPIAAPSANLSGKPSPTKAEHVFNDLNGRIRAIIDGGEVSLGLESTVVDCTKAYPIILRPGSITKEMIVEKLKYLDINDPSEEDKEEIRSPGMKYKHYAPEVPLILLPKEEEKIKGLLENYKKENKRIIIFGRRSFLTPFSHEKHVVLSDDLNEVARLLYTYLRMFTKDEVDVILFESIEEKGIGKAIMNRLKKAST